MKWLSFFKHSQPNPDITDVWNELYFNLIASLVPFVFVAPVPATLMCGFIAITSYIFHFLKWYIYGPVAFALGVVLLTTLRTSFSHGLFSGELFATLFAVLALCKTFNLRNYGDGVLFLILTLATNCTVLLLDTDSSNLILIWTFASILWTVGNLLRINIKDFSSPAVIASLKAALQATLYTLPLLIFLFYIFHRFSHTPFYFERGESVVGLSQSLEPGKISKLSATSGVAFRVKMNENDFPISELYWRGHVLSHSSGMVWHSLKNHHQEIESPPIRIGSSSRCLIDQTIYVQKSSLLGVRFALDEPLQESVIPGTPYHVTSNICSISHLLKDVDEMDFAPYLEVDALVSRKVLNLASRLKGDTTDDFRRNIYHFFKSEDFKYTMTPHTNASLDAFLFGTKEGFCEHYAAALGTLARLAGIPSRIVTGFAGGTYNSYGNFWIVSYSDAHAWVELWDKEKGWVRVDPTAIVAPHRFDKKASIDKFHLENLGMIVDAFFFWVRGLFDNRDTLISLDDLTFNPLHLAALIFVLFCWLQVRRVNQDYTIVVQKLFSKVAQLLDEKTIRRERSEGFENYRKRLLGWLEGHKDLRPLSPSVDKVFKRFIRLKYSATGLAPHELKALHSDLKTLRRALRVKTNFITLLLKRVA
jgi:hypothetical protein